VTFDVFDLRDRVVGEYREYFESFVRIRDEQLDRFVRAQLESGEPWPDAVLQLNPAFVRGSTLGQLAERGIISPQTARFFGHDFRLYRHQEQAVEAAARNENYVVTTGTGSGKSWTYLVPVADHVFRNNPAHHSVRAVIVYPMNALINSQLENLQRLQEQNWPDTPLRFARYTGQEDDEEKERVKQDPPHILLTNYVMLEYMLVRPHERHLLATTTRDLRFLVVDEMHFYRGRQGADVAMLLRRVAQKASKDLRFVGTSATVASGSSKASRDRAVADVASTLFGVEVLPDNVIGESLERIANPVEAHTSGDLAATIKATVPGPSAQEVRSHGLSRWIEECFGVTETDDGLVRQAPTTFNEGVERLAEESGLPQGECRDALKAVLDAGSRASLESGDPVFAFRLHQFLASGRTIYCPIATPERRQPTVTAGYWAPGEKETLLYPLAFCRECGQEYYLCSLEGETLLPGTETLSGFGDEVPGRTGYFAPDREGLWGGEEDLPDSWFEVRKSGSRIKKSLQDWVPQKFVVSPNGSISLASGSENAQLDGEADSTGVQGWWVPKPFLICLNCRTVYEKTMTSDFVKLATLSQTGRSTATTITTASATMQMTAQGVEPDACKVLSFTDNRQDASLQAGHLNDFVQIALLRGALARAVQQKTSLEPHQLGTAAFDALGLAPDEFMATPVNAGPGYDGARRAMVDLLEYRAFEDLRRAWRVAQPNLEQAGLLRIEYAGLPKLALDDDLWRGCPGLEEIDGIRREKILRAVLDHLRSRLVIEAAPFGEDQIKKIVSGANSWLRDPWTIDRKENLHRASVAVLPDSDVEVPYGAFTVSLGPTSGIGKYLRMAKVWGLPHGFDTDEARAMVLGMVNVLRGHLLRPAMFKGQEYGVQIIGASLRWCEGDGKAPPPDPVRFRQSQSRREEEVGSDPNAFFASLYGSRSPNLKRLRGKEHTAQVVADKRIEREKQFREGQLPALFCSPTMELGIDISDLYVVHMRNVPRSPASYAQRSGRAGRGGRPALVLTFCSQGSAHDEHFFRRRTEMIAGSVKPARMDLANRELVEAHFHALWLSTVGASLGSSMAEFLDLETAGEPLQSEFAARLELSERSKQELKLAFRSVVGGESSIIARSSWYSDSWLDELVEDAPRQFDAAMARWRELYEGAWVDLERARKTIDLRNLGKKLDKDEEAAAEARQAEAQREIRLLLNSSDGRDERGESDFYPYRYLASEGFLPGYNFPPQPLRALVRVGDDVQTIARPRFLALSEFGPRNIIYHEGQKNIVTWCLPTGEKLESRLTRAKVCGVCGYIHPGEVAQNVDLCEGCGSRLEGPSFSYPQRLLDQPTIRTRRSERITSSEEERTRSGYNISTHYRFAPNRMPRRSKVVDAAGETIMEVSYASGASVWQINNGSRRSQNPGFTLTLDTGDWRKPDDDPDEDEFTGDGGKVLTDVRPFVRDSRNILLMDVPALDAPASSPHRGREDASLKTLLYALDLGIRLEYQIEENEVQPLLVGSGSRQRILLWEAAEGGTGVWERIAEDPAAFSKIARQALVACHFDPDTGEQLDTKEAKECAACYECLLSYTNQRDHRQLDRFLVRDLLLRLAGSSALAMTQERSYDEQLAWLLDRVDPASSLERSFLEFLGANHLRLPDLGQHQLSGLFVQPDFAYTRDGLPDICLFIDGPAHDDERQRAHDDEVRLELENRGHPVVAIRYDHPLDEQVLRYPDIFGVLA